MVVGQGGLRRAFGVVGSATDLSIMQGLSFVDIPFDTLLF